MSELLLRDFGGNAEVVQQRRVDVAQLVPGRRSGHRRTCRHVSIGHCYGYDKGGFLGRVGTLVVVSSNEKVGSERQYAVTLVLPHLGPGGAQRVASSMASYWVNRGHQVTLVTLLDTPPDFLRLEPGVERFTLPQPNGPLVRIRRFLARQVEGQEPSTDRGRTSGSERFHGENRRLDRLRAMYRAWLRLLASVIGFVARHRLLGQSSRVYALVLSVFYWRVRKLRTFLARTSPDLVLSMLGATNIITVAASVNLSHRAVVSERNDPARQRLDTPWQDLRPILYPAADLVSANSDGALASMSAYCPKGKLCHLPNPLILTDESVRLGRSNGVLFLARLVPQKAPDILIEAFASFARTAPDWTLHVAGDGPMAEELRKRTSVLGLNDRVVFHGLVTDTAPLFAMCRIFVLPSRFEGTPNALLEAMASRLPCIVSDASPGPLQLIEHGVSGLVGATGSVGGLAAAMKRLSADEQLQRELGEAGFERVREFGVSRVGAIWDRMLFERLAGTEAEAGREPASVSSRT